MMDILDTAHERWNVKLDTELTLVQKHTSFIFYI